MKGNEFKRNVKTMEHRLSKTRFLPRQKYKQTRKEIKKRPNRPYANMAAANEHKLFHQPKK